MWCCLTTNEKNSNIYNIWCRKELPSCESLYSYQENDIYQKMYKTWIQLLWNYRWNSRWLKWSILIMIRVRVLNRTRQRSGSYKLAKHTFDGFDLVKMLWYIWSNGLAFNVRSISSQSYPWNLADSPSSFHINDNMAFSWKMGNLWRMSGQNLKTQWDLLMTPTIE